MFGHNLKYSLKVLLKNKMLIFWTFAFPIVLGIFFNMAFSNIENSEKLDIIDIAIINNETFNNNEGYRNAFQDLSNSDSEQQMFNIKYVDLEEAKELLQEEKITGYVLFENNNNTITVNNSGINETILRYVVDEITSNTNIISDLVTEKVTSGIAIDYEKIYQEAYALVKESDAKLNNVSNKNLSYTMIEYYTLIAMTSLYGGIISMFIVNYKLANMNSVGKRTAVSPVKKGRMLIASLLASYIVQLLGLILLFIFMVLVIKVDFGHNLPLIILLALVGSLAGLSLGVAIATLFKTNENAKTGIMIAFSMLGCFLSGMMGITMKYVIDKNVPIINKLNPASMITDGFYALYYYDTLDRFYLNVLSLIIFSFLMLIISIKGLRRQKYDSI